MSELKLEQLSSLDNAEQHGGCPVCGAQMKEIDRLNEGSRTYIWFTCEKQGCGGQWLQKKTRSS